MKMLMVNQYQTLEYDANISALKLIYDNLENYVPDKTIMELNWFVASNFLYPSYCDKSLFFVYKSPMRKLLDYCDRDDNKKIKNILKTCDYGFDKGGKITYHEFNELKNIANGKVKTMSILKHLGY